jgi:hypothetical protein
MLDPASHGLRLRLRAMDDRMRILLDRHAISGLWAMGHEEKSLA